ncbi:MAG: sigma-54 dependent transcriptional regulator [Candidatus Kapaibacterium sp.]
MAERLIYVVDDEDNVRRLLEHWLKTKWGHTLRLFSTGEQCLEALADGPDLVILDIMMPGIGGIETLKKIKEHSPDLPVIMLSAQGRIEVAVEALKLGAIDYFTKAIDLPKLEVAVTNAFRIYDLTREVTVLRESIQKTGHFDNIITSDGAMDDVLMLVRKAKDSDISVLVQGESGTGKELIARAIHFNGKRKDGPFVAVNCAAIPKDLIESEMFGHEKGSFTGAHTRKIGKFEQAHGGTIFLDEIGELELNLQAKLLRAIQIRQFERVGGTELVTVDVRIVSATNKDLIQASREKEFREDLYYRLGSFPIVLPPLRQRRSDILLIAEHFLSKFNAEQGKAIKAYSRRALKIMYDYPWPGNVRELEGAVERAVLLADGDTISEEDLPLAVRLFAQGEGGAVVPSAALFENQDGIMPLETVKEQAVKHALKVTEGNILEAARKLGISRSTLYELIKKYNVEV